MVVPKALATAIQEDDHILGVVAGSSINQCSNNGHIIFLNGAFR